MAPVFDFNKNIALRLASCRTRSLRRSRSCHSRLKDFTPLSLSISDTNQWERWRHRQVCMSSARHNACTWHSPGRYSASPGIARHSATSWLQLQPMRPPSPGVASPWSQKPARCDDRSRTRDHDFACVSPQHLHRKAPPPLNSRKQAPVRFYSAKKGALLEPRSRSTARR